MLHDPGYRFCPKCGTGFEKLRLKSFEPERLVCPACRFVMYLNPKVAAGVVVEYEGGVVLLRREVAPRAGYWAHPGGFVDRGETLQQAAKREAFEEVGLDVEIGDLLGAFSYENSEVVIVSYAGRVLGGEPVAGDESLEVKIFPQSEIPWDELAFPSTVGALRAFVDRYPAAPTAPPPAPPSLDALRDACARALAARDALAALRHYPDYVSGLRRARHLAEALRAAEEGLLLTNDPALARLADEIAHEKAEAEQERC